MHMPGPGPVDTLMLDYYLFMAPMHELFYVHRKAVSYQLGSAFYHLH